MLTIAIDEYGHFNHDDKVSFVGGYIYTGEDFQEERLRLFNFLKQTCEGFGLNFPNDMHYDSKGSNRRQVKYFEDNIERPLKEYFIKNGKYHLIGMVKSRQERMDFVNISNLVDDRKANNLYEHMTNSLLRNIIFNNISTKDHQIINLEIPTRVSVIENHNKDKIEEYMTLGYEGKEITTEKKHIFYSTDQKTFKSTLSYMIMNSDKKHSTKFESINIQSIDYKQENEEMAYLYLADTICNSFKARLNTNKQNYGIQSIHDWAKSFTGGNEPYIWAYDDIDTLYNTIMEEYNKKNFVETLTAINSGKKSSSDFTKYYIDNHFKFLEENIHKSFDINNVSVYISQLDAYYKKDHIDYDEGGIIFDKLWELVMGNRERIDKAAIYSLADIGIRVYNHRGLGSSNNPYYEICEDLKQYVPIETYLNTLNRSVQIYVNEFDFHKAIEKQSYILECLDILKKAIVDISELNETEGNISTGITSRGRALSSLGQFYAFKRDVKALDYFEEALEEFHTDQGNSKITISHILNFASDQRNIKLYEKYAPMYFGNMEGIHDQLTYLEKDSSGNPFGVYTYMKGLNNLYIDQIDDEFIKRILSLDFTKLGYDTNSNPWQLIYKNIGLILFKKNKEKLAVKYMDKALECIYNPGDAIEAINHFTNMQKSFYMKNNQMLIEAVEEFKTWLEKRPNIQEYFKEVFVEDSNETYRRLDEKFTFTYV